MPIFRNQVSQWRIYDTDFLGQFFALVSLAEAMCGQGTAAECELLRLTQPYCAFTPDATCANKSRYSRVVGRLNILSLLASFAREIHFTTDANSRHGRGFCQAAPVSLRYG